MTADRTESVTQTTVTDPATPASQVTQREVTHEKVSGGRLAARIIRFITGVVVALLVVRFLLVILEASRNSGFVDFMLDITQPLVAPFEGIFGNPTDTVRFEPQTVAAIVVYLLIGATLAYLFRIKQPRS